MDSGLTELLGYAAAGLVLTTFSVRSITALRSVAIASNLMFIAYAVFAQLVPVLVLHALLLPLNLWRLCEAPAATAQGRRRRRDRLVDARRHPPGIRAHGNGNRKFRCRSHPSRTDRG